MTETTVEKPKKKPAAGATGFLRVQHPEVWPQRCVICHATKGPLVDTRKQGVGAFGDREDRIYVCGQCAKLCALELGLIEGERMEQLLAAGDQLEADALAITERDRQIEEQLSELAARARKVEALDELLQQARDAERTLQRQLELINEMSRVGSTA